VSGLGPETQVGCPLDSVKNFDIYNGIALGIVLRLCNSHLLLISGHDAPEEAGDPARLFVLGLRGIGVVPFHRSTVGIWVSRYLRIFPVQGTVHSTNGVFPLRVNRLVVIFKPLSPAGSILMIMLCGGGPELNFDSEGSSFHVPTEGSSAAIVAKQNPRVTTVTNVSIRTRIRMYFLQPSPNGMVCDETARRVPPEEAQSVEEPGRLSTDKSAPVKVVSRS
jgi:hypothetical protein